jgi:hypothetical protein
MKKKWIALKRRWKKLEKGDRGMFQVYGWYAALMIAMSFVSVEFIVNAFWSLVVMFFASFYIARRRLDQYKYFLKGSIRQDRLDWITYTRIRYENAELGFKLKQLNSDYKKLEYDYNQLKKIINNPKKINK